MDEIKIRTLDLINLASKRAGGGLNPEIIYLLLERYVDVVTNFLTKKNVYALY
jgi:hypothetical protein